MKRRPSLLLYRQCSQGLGHLSRSIALTRALSAQFDVTLVSGGRLPRAVRIEPDVRIVQLPPVGFDASGHLVSLDGRRTLESALSERQRMLWDTYRAVAPNAIVVELFPFGPRAFRRELLPVLEDARRRVGESRPITCCSVRDLLVRRAASRIDRDREAAAVLQRLFDAVLVHSDPAFAQIEESLSTDVSIRVPLYYTGFVHDVAPAARRGGVPAGTIIVSAGSGVAGDALLRTAIEAHGLAAAAGAPPLTVVAGPLLSEDAWRNLQTLAQDRPRIKLLRSVPNLGAELTLAAGSISHCGYTTAMDLIASEVPAVVVPHCTEAEDEQLRRSRRLASLGAVRLVLPDEATPERLAREMASLASFKPRVAALDLKGAERSARMLANLWHSGAAPRIQSAAPEYAWSRA